MLQITLTEEQFDIDHKLEVTLCSQLCIDIKETAQCLLNHYVKVQGLAISQVCFIPSYLFMPPP